MPKYPQSRVGPQFLRQREAPSAQVNRCLSIKGAEDILNKPHAFEVSTTDDSMFFIADTDKVCLMCVSCMQQCMHVATRLVCQDHSALL